MVIKPLAGASVWLELDAQVDPTSGSTTTMTSFSALTTSSATSTSGMTMQVSSVFAGENSKASLLFAARAARARLTGVTGKVQGNTEGTASGVNTCLNGVVPEKKAKGLKWHAH